MRIVALLAVRNEELYLERCLLHLYHQGIETCLIDHASTDRTIEIAEKYLDKGVFRIESIPFNGIFEWLKLLNYKRDLARKIDADWFIHHDADEIREAPRTFRDLSSAITDVDKKGYNAINSDELVFIPVSENQSFEGRDYVKEMKYYYYFRPRPLHRVNIWKKTDEPVDLAGSGGHSITFNNLKLYPRNFILRHYLVLSKKHAMKKYGQRNYDPSELAKGMNVQRVNFNPKTIRFPAPAILRKVAENRDWDLSDPWSTHYFFQEMSVSHEAKTAME